MATDPDEFDLRPVSGARGEEGSVPSLSAATALLLVAAGLYILGGIPLQLLFGEPGLLLSQILFLALPVVWLIQRRGYDPAATLALRMPTGRQVGAGLLLLSGATWIAWFLAWLQGFFVEVPVEFLEAMAEVLTADSVGRFVWLLILVAVVPAFAEELLFRGVLLTGFRTRTPAVVAVILTGLIFGLFHVAPQTGFRIIPTAWLGMVLAWVVVASGSLPLAMLLHFVNNGALLALAAMPRTRDLVTGTEAAPPLVLLPLAIAFLAAGLYLLGRPGPPAPSSRWEGGRAPP